MLLIFLPISVDAADVSYSAGIVLATYDNINRLKNPTEQESSYTLRAGLSLADETPDYSVSVDGNVRSTKYINNLAADRVSGDMVANLLWKIRPGQYSWVLNDTFTQSAIVTLDNDRPSNRQNVNIISTGPDYSMRFNATNKLSFSARLESYRYESKQINRDNNRGKFLARWTKQLNSRLNISINDEAESVKFSDNIFNNFDRNDIFLGVGYNSGIHSLKTEYGFTNIGNDARDNARFNRYLLGISRANSRNSKILFSYQSLVTDTGRQITQNVPTQGDGDEVFDTVSSDLFVDETLRAQYVKQGISLGFNLNFYTRNRVFETRKDLNLDTESQGAIVSGNWRFSQNNNIIYSASYINTLYKDTLLNREDEDYRYKISYKHRFKRHVVVGLSVLSSERDSPNTSFSYKNLTVIFNLNYTSL
ncbi:hypothetical protein MNBD_GAMMA11-2959 [hydrothermal vent metagenome]|uniref:Capsular polysaccharide synthesis enzyme CpsB n=1 Tax=hydrothermal vent metagenome TaxID=652676 RepID=A0A3B0XB19_9ZZZZ